MKKTLLVVLSLVLSLNTFAQNNVVKLNVTNLAFKMAQVNYERAFLKKFSGQLGVGYMFNSVPGPVKNALPSDATAPSLTGMFIAPEARFYVNPAKQSPKGFYLSLWGRYSRFALNTGWDFLGNNGATQLGDLDANLNSIGGGIGFGTQWLIADKVAIDVMWFGIGYGTNKVKAEGGSASMTQADYEAAANDFNTSFEAPGNMTFKATPNANSMTIESSGIPFPKLRLLSFSVGYAF